MHYLALATDYDGTIAHDGVVPDATIDALLRLQKSGRVLIMVTGRELPELLQVFPHAHIFDRIVAENGALLYHPATHKQRLLAPEPPPALVEALRARNVPISVGRSIVATVEPHEHAVLTTIHELGLEWHVVFNKGSVMVLPPGITKAAGLGPALEELNLSADHVVGIGDAENDHAFLQLCGCAVAVANALPAVKEAADWTTPSPRGVGVVELIERMIADDLIDLHPKRAHHFPKPATAHEMH